MDNKSRKELLDEIENALGAVAFGSVEIYVNDSRVTQISVRNIKKTSIQIPQAEVETHESKESTPTNTQYKTFKIHTHFRRTQ